MSLTLALAAGLSILVLAQSSDPKPWRIMAFPTVILLDPDGVIHETSSSALRGENLVPPLERVLQK